EQRALCMVEIRVHQRGVLEARIVSGVEGFDEIRARLQILDARHRERAVGEDFEETDQKIQGNADGAAAEEGREPDEDVEEAVPVRLYGERRALVGARH